jgi:hypothetical protein
MKEKLLISKSPRRKPKSFTLKVSEGEIEMSIESRNFLNVFSKSSTSTIWFSSTHNATFLLRFEIKCIKSLVGSLRVRFVV